MLCNFKSLYNYGVIERRELEAKFIEIDLFVVKLTLLS